MGKLRGAEYAPDFEMLDLDGRLLRLSDYRGKTVLLTFFRYVTCPFCTMRFVRLSQEAHRLGAHGVQIIGVFESNPAAIRSAVSRRGLPFPIIADPAGALYARYGVKTSLLGLVLGMFRVPTLMRALTDRHYRLARPNGSFSRLPADFLIGLTGPPATSDKASPRAPPHRGRRPPPSRCDPEALARLRHSCTDVRPQSTARAMRRERVTPPR